jgi:tetratricopeptide (TPR) repeat protein
MSADSCFKDASRAYKQADLKLAEQHLKVALTIDPRHVKSLILKGVIYNARGKYDKAVDVFDLALEVDPANGLAFGELRHRKAPFVLYLYIVVSYSMVITDQIVEGSCIE